MNLSPHFTLEEFLYSAKADELGIINNPEPKHIDAMRALAVNVHEPARRIINRPLKIISGFRCLALNKAVDGADNSQHLYGEAADTVVIGGVNAELWTIITSRLEYDQCIAEYLKVDDPSAGWVHVSFRAGKNRKEALSCIGKGKYVKGLVFV